MNGHGQSDGPVPANLLNKAAAAEAGEERGPARGNTAGETRPGRSAGSGVSSDRDRVRQVAVRDKDARFTALLHQVSLPRLMLAFEDLNSKAAPGVDGVTWQEYQQDLVADLRDLHGRVQSGRYRASPSRRVYIPKADGRQRPLGIATLEDKIVQRAAVDVTDEGLSWRHDEDKIAAEAALDGIYVIRTSLPADALSPGGAVTSYKALETWSGCSAG